MRDATKIGVVGAGATGAYLAARLADAGLKVTLVARRASLDHIREHGIEIHNADGSSVTARPEQVVAPGEDVEPVDFALFSVKGYDTQEAASALDPLIGDRGHVVCLQNGVRNEVALADRFGSERILSGVLYIGSERLAPGVIKCSSPPRLVLGPFHGEELAPANGLRDAFQQAGIETRVTSQVVRDKWQKFLFNCGLNPLTTMTGMRMGQLLELPASAAAFEDLVDEALAVALASGAPLGTQAKQEVMEVARRMDIFSSMGEDHKAGRPLELEAFTGYVLELGARYQVPTPATRIAHVVLTALDSQSRAGGNQTASSLPA